MQTLIWEVEKNRNKQKKANEHQKQLIEMQKQGLEKLDLELKEKVL